MFSISAEGTIFFNGEAVGYLSLDSDRTSRSGQRQMEFTVRGRVVEKTETPGSVFGDMVFSARIGAAGARTFLQDPDTAVAPY